jgi:hypothetical protein
MTKKLALEPNSNSFYAYASQICREAVLKYGKTSESYLMRKLKCSQSIAKEVINRGTSDNAHYGFSVCDKEFLGRGTEKPL